MGGGTLKIRVRVSVKVIVRARVIRTITILKT